MSLKLYVDMMSQPSRALYTILKHSTVPFEPITIKLVEGQQFTPEFKKINRFRKVPAIDHNGFNLSESVAILGYLAQCNLIPEDLYPKKNNESQARVEEFLAWQHIGLRLPLGLYFVTGFLEPMKTGKPPNPKSLENFKGKMEEALNVFDTQWIGEGRNYVTGDKVSVGDVIAACEIEQPRLLGYNAFEKYPNIAAWHKRVQDHFKPHYDDSHRIFNLKVEKLRQENKL